MGGQKKRDTFKKKRTKVGQQAAKPANYTDTTVSFKRINMIQQSITTDKSRELYLSARQQTVGTLISQAKNCSVTTRREAMSSLYRLCKQHGAKFARDKGVEVADACLNSMLDCDSKVRKTASDILILLSSLSPHVKHALGRILTLKLELALGSLDDDTVNDALQLMQSPFLQGLNSSILRLFPMLLRKPSLFDAACAALHNYLSFLCSSANGSANRQHIISLADLWASELRDSESIDEINPSAPDSLYACACVMLELLLDVNDGLAFSFQLEGSRKQAIRYFYVLYTLYSIVKVLPQSRKHSKTIVVNIRRLFAMFPVSAVSATDTLAQSLAQVFNLLILYLAIHFNHFNLLRDLFQTQSRSTDITLSTTSFTSLVQALSEQQTKTDTVTDALSPEEEMGEWMSHIVELAANIADSLTCLTTNLQSSLPRALHIIYVDVVCEICSLQQNLQTHNPTILRQLLLFAPINCKRQILVRCLEHAQQLIESSTINKIDMLLEEIDYLLSLGFQELCRRPAQGAQLWETIYCLLLQRQRTHKALPEQLITVINTFVHTEFSGKVISTTGIIEQTYDPQCGLRVTGILAGASA